MIGTKIKFPSVSVGATENALLAAFGARGKTILNNCAIEPEVLDLVSFLKKLGCKIHIKEEKLLLKDQKR